jgi:3-deoxy-manno-octulosonate cytidylyltransferase (CMP-KDO synthetase)
VKTLIATPARLPSARLPNKLLQDVHGKPLLAYTLARLSACEFADRALVTDSEMIARAAEEHSDSVRALYDSRASGNGTIRIAKALDRIQTRYAVICNWQADEVLLSAHDVRNAIEHHVAYNPEGVTTLVEGLSKEDEHNPNVVKAACNNGRVYWFSRGRHVAGHMKHVGLYVFGANTLGRINELFVHPAALEASLEQLTWVCAGIPFACVRAERPTFSVNDAADLEKFRAMTREV